MKDTTDYKATLASIRQQRGELKTEYDSKEKLLADMAIETEKLYDKYQFDSKKAHIDKIDSYLKALSFNTFSMNIVTYECGKLVMKPDIRYWRIIPFDVEETDKYYTIITWDKNENSDMELATYRIDIIVKK